MTSPVEALVQQLDSKADESYDARAELIWIGSDAIPAVIDGLPSLGGFGQLTAIEVFEAVGDPRCGPALIGLLHSDNPTVREWAAIALASLEINAAVEPLRRAYRACLARATPPDWTEPDGIRWALTELGARSPVVPRLTARLRAIAADGARRPLDPVGQCPAPPPRPPRLHPRRASPLDGPPMRLRQRLDPAIAAAA
ncbi:HEAT repeat domain-containing protein [Streptomyces goshikiensis]|uniref:HEAT repeat domain-containing protein n=1 Tax=Streptomyces goshikiensis TaxID=1942 RepID=UPI003684513B